MGGTTESRYVGCTYEQWHLHHHWDLHHQDQKTDLMAPFKKRKKGEKTSRGEIRDFGKQEQNGWRQQPTVTTPVSPSMSRHAAAMNKKREGLPKALRFSISDIKWKLSGSGVKEGPDERGNSLKKRSRGVALQCRKTRRQEAGGGRNEDENPKRDRKKEKNFFERNKEGKVGRVLVKKMEQRLLPTTHGDLSMKEEGVPLFKEVKEQRE